MSFAALTGRYLRRIENEPPMVELRRETLDLRTATMDVPGANLPTTSERPKVRQPSGAADDRLAPAWLAPARGGACAMSSTLYLKED
jgi:hypothetical protein